ncbi:MAG: hypothetical protein C3F13_17370 [Anaerolineales bacterium]|nr:glycosyltransferase [Anaerolineae bacterium]PWB50237.1 MAG: hypothetical protein C3F13_17370 [Anaerolineales bacterium]
MTALYDNLNLVYHRQRWGSDRLDDSQEIFQQLAERIILDLHPGSVLDVGCGSGALVRALRQRGVDAWGTDDPGTSIQAFIPEFQAFCQLASVLEPLPQSHYDLIVCIDVLEHVSNEHTAQVVENLCSHADQILFSCIPLEVGAGPHANVQPPEAWAEIFYRFGFQHDLDYDSSFIAPWAMRFVRTQLALKDRIQLYERKLWQLSQEVSLRRELAVEYKLELAKKEMDLQSWKPQHLQAELDAIRNSTSWRIITRFQRLREWLIPPGSRRETFMRRIFYGFSVLHREGVKGFIALSVARSKSKIEIQSSRLRNRYRLRHAKVSGTGQSCSIAAVEVRPPLTAHTCSVDIIICVHNALKDVQHCLASLFENTTQPYHLILVDDGSDSPTAQYLHEFSEAHPALLLRSDTATGYPSAANRGMQASTAEFVVLLNSDTILTPAWLDRLATCIQTDPAIGMVGPLSNTASWQSVPRIEDDGDWASNPLPAGLSPAGMSDLVASKSARLYPDMPLLNGFCLMIRRKLLDQVGYFDDVGFSQGYGEEDDLVLRARKQGWKMALADDVYIYHAQSKSYSTEKRIALAERAQKVLREKHGEKIIAQGVKFCRQAPVLEGIRARAQVAFERDQCIRRCRQFAGKKLLFILPVNCSGGGANVIRSESIAMQQMGVEVSFYNQPANRAGFEMAYPDLAQSVIYGEAEYLPAVARNFDVVIATYNPTVSWLKQLDTLDSHPILGYYIQGFEPLMYVKGSQAYNIALESYSLLENIRLISKTDWTRQQVQRASGRECRVIGPSVDIDLNRPRPRTSPLWPVGPLKLTAMIRPESPYREPRKTLELLQRAVEKYKGEVEANLFGTPPDNPAFLELSLGFPWKMYGVLNPSQVAHLLSQTDIFIDYSSHQAMGLTAMEAMACGCGVIVPHNGGASSYAVHEKNSLIVDCSSFENVWSALQRLIQDEGLRNRLQHNAIHDICAFYPERAALNILQTLFTG